MAEEREIRPDALPASPAPSPRRRRPGLGPGAGLLSQFLQFQPHVFHQLEPPLRVFPQAAANDPPQIPRDIPHWLGFFPQNRRECGHAAVALKCAASGHHLVQQRSEREDVAARVHLLALGLFGRHVGGGADHRAFFRSSPQRTGGSLLGGGLLFDELGQTEVEHLHQAALIHHQVGGF